MQAESKLHDETVQVYKAVKLLCAQYHVGHPEMRTWMEAIHAFDQYGHGFISAEQVRIIEHHAPRCDAGPTPEGPTECTRWSRGGHDAAVALNVAQTDGVLEVLDYHLDEDLNYKLHWHLEQGHGQVHITEFVEYLCCQHMRISKAREEGTDADQTALQGPMDRMQKFSNPVAEVAEN